MERFKSEGKEQFQSNGAARAKGQMEYGMFGELNDGQ